MIKLVGETNLELITKEINENYANKSILFKLVFESEEPLFYYKHENYVFREATQFSIIASYDIEELIEIESKIEIGMTEYNEVRNIAYMDKSYLEKKLREELENAVNEYTGRNKKSETKPKLIPNEAVKDLANILISSGNELFTVSSDEIKYFNQKSVSTIVNNSLGNVEIVLSKIDKERLNNNGHQLYKLLDSIVTNKCLNTTTLFNTIVASNTPFEPVVVKEAKIYGINRRNFEGMLQDYIVALNTLMLNLQLCTVDGYNTEKIVFMENCKKYVSKATVKKYIRGENTCTSKSTKLLINRVLQGQNKIRCMLNNKRGVIE